MKDFIKSAKSNWYIIVIILVLVSVLGVGFSVIQTPRYESSVKLLVIQKQGDRMDAYTAARSAETVSELLSKVIYTSSFFDKVMDSGFEVKNEYSKNLQKSKEEWQKKISANVIDNVGTLEVGVYDEERFEAEKLAYAVAYILTSKGDTYHGGGKNIEIKMIDSPITSASPVQPDIWQNLALSVILGGIIASVLVLILRSREKKIPVSIAPTPIARDYAEPVYSVPEPEPKPQEEVTVGQVETMPEIEQINSAKKARDEYEKRSLEQTKFEKSSPVVKSAVTSFSGSKKDLVKKFNAKSQINLRKPRPSKKISTPVLSSNKQESGGYIKFQDFKNRMNRKMKDKEIRMKDRNARRKTSAPQVMSTSPSNNQQKQVMKDQKKGKDYYHPQSVDEWVKTGKFKPREAQG